MGAYSRRGLLIGRKRSYVETLAELPTAERERLMHGDWEIPDDGDLFKRDWFCLIEPHQLPAGGLRAAR